MKIDRFDEDWPEDRDEGPPEEEAESEAALGSHERPGFEEVPEKPPEPDYPRAKPQGRVPKERSSPRAGSRKDFICGHLSTPWFLQAFTLPKSAVKVGLALWQEAGMKKDQFYSKDSPESGPLRLHSHMRDRWGLDRSTVSRGLTSLAEQGLIRIIDARDGRMSTVVIRNIAITDPPADDGSL